MAASHLLGAGVSDSLGVPSVSLLSEDAVASESVGGGLVREGWGLWPTREVLPQLCGRARGADVLFWGGPQPPETSSTTDFLAGLPQDTSVKHLTAC